MNTQEIFFTPEESLHHACPDGKGELKPKIRNGILNDANAMG
jgi:hypothetical protein